MPQRLDFKHIAETVDIFAVAKHLGLVVVRDRAYCPACESDRALELVPETNTFRCWKAEPREPSHKCLTGDCITLYAHVKGYDGMYKAAKELAEQFLSGDVRTVNPGRETVPPTPPQKPERGANLAQSAKEVAFDPHAFAAKLTYSTEVAALGISEADAARLCIGWHPQRKMVYFCSRNPDGSPSGFVGIKDVSAVKVPPRWIASATNVVALRRA